MMTGAMKQLILICALTALLVGCGQQLSYSGSKTVVGGMDDVRACRLLGTTKVSLHDAQAKVLAAEQVAERLEIAARNFAARIGANTVAPAAEVEAGKRNFQLYVCQEDF